MIIYVIGPILIKINKESATVVEVKLILEWVHAMNEELLGLDRSSTWTLTQLPKGKRAIGNKWVFKLKLKPNGDVDHYKARLIAKGYNQVVGLDYVNCFAPVAKVVTVHILFAFASSYGWDLHQLDINNAFLHDSIDEAVYMHPPKGYNKAKPGEVCLLQKSLYGLKQASQQWNLELTHHLSGLGFL